MPIQGRDIVLLSHQRYDTHVTSVQNIVDHMAARNRVLFVEQPESLAWLTHEPPARAALKWILNPLEHRAKNLFIYHTPPIFLPGQGRSPFIAASVNRTYTRIVRKAIRKAGFRDPIFWIFQFSAQPVVDALQPELAVYECAEEWHHYETRPQIRQYIDDTDRMLCERADVVFVPSRALYESKSRHNEQTFLVPWGVDTELYARTFDPDTPIPKDIAHLKHPIVGMFGMLDGRRLHIELLNHLATRHPDWNIVLVGRCMPNLDRGPLDALPNVHWPGFKDVNELPGYCKAYDVCIIPYMINEFTTSIMPLKLVEYLATGKPVVSTALPAADQFRDVIHVAGTIEDFERGVIKSLKEQSQEDRQLRLERSKEFSWKVLADRKMQIAADHLAGRLAEAVV